jgi:hypothetical protein
MQYTDLQMSLLCLSVQNLAMAPVTLLPPLLFKSGLLR